MKKEKGRITRPNHAALFPQVQRKDSNLSLNMQVLSLLKSERLTAREINIRINNGFNDSRKVISVLRRKGYNIADYQLCSNKTTKVYYCAMNIEKGGEQ